MNDFLGGMNPGFPSSFLSVVEESAPTNKLTNAAIRESKTVLSDKDALKQQANSDRFNNQTEGAVPIAQNDIEPPKADDYQRLAQRMGGGPVIDARLAETRALNPFIPISPVPTKSVQVRFATAVTQKETVNVPTWAKFFSIVASNDTIAISFGGAAEFLTTAGTIEGSTYQSAATGVVYYDASGVSSISLCASTANTNVVVSFYK